MELTNCIMDTVWFVPLANFLSIQFYTIDYVWAWPHLKPYNYMGNSPGCGGGYQLNLIMLQFQEVIQSFI